MERGVEQFLRVPSNTSRLRYLSVVPLIEGSRYARMSATPPMRPLGLEMEIELRLPRMATANERSHEVDLYTYVWPIGSISVAAVR